MLSSLPPGFLQFEKQLMTKIEMRRGFKPLGNLSYIKRKNNSQNKNLRKKKELYFLLYHTTGKRCKFFFFKCYTEAICTTSNYNEIYIVTIHLHTSLKISFQSYQCKLCLNMQFLKCHFQLQWYKFPFSERNGKLL